MATRKQRRAANAAQAREAARAEAARLKAEREAKSRRKRTMIAGITVGAVALTAILVVVIFTIVSKSQDTATMATAPQGATSDGGITIGQDGVAGGSAPSGDDVVTIDIYSDYMCPYCGKLELGMKDALKEVVTSGQARVVFHPVPFLDRFSEGTEYSTRATNAAVTIAAKAPEKFWDFHTTLFEKQPAENTEGISDEELATIAKDVGVPEEVASTLADGEYKDWVKAAYDKAVASGVTGTPSVFMTLGSGERQLWKNSNSGAVARAVEAVKAGGTPDDPNQ
jgi:protein-disulfide isomerase